MSTIEGFNIIIPFQAVILWIYINIISFLVLHRNHIFTFIILSNKSIFNVHSPWVERMYNLFTPCNCGFAAFSYVRSTTFCHFHCRYAWHPSAGHLEWWDWHRAAEKGNVQKIRVILHELEDRVKSFLYAILFHALQRVHKLSKLYKSK